MKLRTWTVLAALALAPTARAQEGATMKAIRYHEYNEAEVLKYEDAPKPEPARGEVLVRVHAAGVNPVDWKVRAGAFKARGAEFPQIPGYDVAGVVEKVGEGVERLKAGDEVFGFLSLSHGGAYAEYVAASERELALKPKKIDFVQSAAVPLAALTAWQALFDSAGLEAGQTVLIHAGAGGVGHFAVQLAKRKGAKVIATASEANHEFLRELGADQVIDYTKQHFEELVKDVDVVLDPIGGETVEGSMAVLKKNGFLVSIVGKPPQQKLSQYGVRGDGILVHPDGDELAEIAKLIDAGTLKPHVSAVVPLAEAKRAHEMSETGHTRGKIVLEVVAKAKK
jgi:NADPH:quinone reductase-like Zn-dependent oxidoreductase